MFSRFDFKLLIRYNLNIFIIVSIKKDYKSQCKITTLISSFDRWKEDDFVFLSKNELKVIESQVVDSTINYKYQVAGRTYQLVPISNLFHPPKNTFSKLILFIPTCTCHYHDFIRCHKHFYWALVFKHFGLHTLLLFSWHGLTRMADSHHHLFHTD